jgi:hypothetical protein
MNVYTGSTFLAFRRHAVICTALRSELHFIFLKDVSVTQIEGADTEIAVKSEPNRKDIEQYHTWY